MGSIDRKNVSETYLIFGNGFIANQIKDILLTQGKTVTMSNARTESSGQVLSELTKHKPTRVINCAGTRGTPNADWCEDHKVETMRSNVLGVLVVVDTCFQLGIHVTQIGSACIYTLSEGEVKDHSPFKETDEPFFQGCWYGRSRLLSELTIRHYPNLLLLRIRLPISADLHGSGHIGRLLKFEKIVDLSGSGTVLSNLLPAAIILSENAEIGIYNFVSPDFRSFAGFSKAAAIFGPISNRETKKVTPGEISNVEIMELAKKYVKPDLKWQTFGLDDMLKTLKAPRANCIMDTTKLQKKLKEYGYEIKEHREALEEAFQIMKGNGIQV